MTPPPQFEKNKVTGTEKRELHLSEEQIQVRALNNLKNVRDRAN